VPRESSIELENLANAWKNTIGQQMAGIFGIGLAAFTQLKAGQRLDNQQRELDEYKNRINQLEQEIASMRQERSSASSGVKEVEVKVSPVKETSPVKQGSRASQDGDRMELGCHSACPKLWCQ
jgi:hypothetical protein